jgi:hypothetical protein
MKSDDLNTEWDMEDTPRRAEDLLTEKLDELFEGGSYETYSRFMLAYGAQPSGYLARMEWRTLLQGIPDPHRLEHFGRKIYSQAEEDGILEEIFRRLAITRDSGKFIEFGASNGLQFSNTLYLLYRGFSGLWIEWSEPHVDAIRSRFQLPLASGQLRLARALVTAENINDLLLENLGDQREVALLSIDIDGNDFWVWKAITSIAPAVVVIEYNGKFPPPLSIAQEYRPNHVWNFTDYSGASLEALARLGRQKGYQLVGCNITGVNAFFVREDLVAGHFPYSRTATNLYHPCRFYLSLGGCFMSSGHVADFGKYVEID